MAGVAAAAKLSRVPHASGAVKHRRARVWQFAAPLRAASAKRAGRGGRLQFQKLLKYRPQRQWSAVVALPRPLLGPFAPW
jgi:hypothetical protein